MKELWHCYTKKFVFLGEVYHKDMTPAGSGDWTTMKMMFGLGTGTHTNDTSGQGTYRADDSMTNTNTAKMHKRSKKEMKAKNKE